MVTKVTKPVTYNFTPDLFEKITVEAKNRNMTRNALVAEILGKALKKVKASCTKI